MAIVVPVKRKQIRNFNLLSHNSSNDYIFAGFPVLKGVFPEKFTHANSVKEIFSKIFWMHIYIYIRYRYQCICEMYM